MRASRVSIDSTNLVNDYNVYVRVSAFPFLYKHVLIINIYFWMGKICFMFSSEKFKCFEFSVIEKREKLEGRLLNILCASRCIMNGYSSFKIEKQNYCIDYFQMALNIDCS